jgi:non-ribosomal peptide synthetase-like protein
VFFRLFGAKVGRRVYLETTDMTEYDLVTIGDDAALNRDCTVQTHLFEDRVMKMSTVVIGEDCSVGSVALVLYDTAMERGSSLGSLSLQMKGEVLPAWTSWEGSPAARRV